MAEKQISGLAEDTTPAGTDILAKEDSAGVATKKSSLVNLFVSTVAKISSFELGHATDTTVARSAAGVLSVEGVVLPSISSTNTLTNKRMTKRPVVVTEAAEPAINVDNGDIFTITALAQAITSLTANLTGTPTDGQMILMRITDDGTSRDITPGASFAGTSGNDIGSLATTIGKAEYLLWMYSSALSKWELLGRDHSA